MAPSNPVRDLLLLHGAGRYAEMEKRARALLTDAPGHAVLNELVGIALTAQRRNAEALAFLQKASLREPADPQFWENLGLCQIELKEFEAAEEALRRSLALRPNSADAINALGSVFRARRKMDESQLQFERALALDSRHVGANFNLGRTLAEKGEWTDAERCYRNALAADPKRAEVAVALAELLLLRGRRQDAMETADRGHALLGGAPARVSADNISTLDGLAALFDALGQVAKALAIYKSTFAFKPEPKRALSAALAAHRLCDWDFVDKIEPLALQLAKGEEAIEGIAPWSMLSLEKASAANQLAIARNFARALVERTAILPRPALPPRRQRLKIGYFSADFFDHATSHLIAGVIEAHDRARFEIVGYDLAGAAEDDYRRRLKAAFDDFVPVRDLSNEAAARRIAEDRADIVVDLNGWTSGNRAGVLAMRPAPLQMQWLGYAGTLGAPWIDYIVADRVLIPPEDERFYSEKAIRLPDTYQPNDDKRPVGEAKARRDHGLPDGDFVFCSFSQSYKIGREIFEVWLDLLRAVPHSVLWLIASPEPAMAALQAHAAARGIATDRLIFAPIAPSPDHRARIRHADLALDCFPYGSHTTGSDALHAGVPLVALKGDTFASRVSASLLQAAGLPELITPTIEDYRSLCLRLAREKDALSALRARIASHVRSSPLFDTAAFTRGLERAFETAWERHVSGAPPQSFDIAP